MKARRSNSRHLVLTLALAFSFTCLATAADQPTPRSLIELGITAQGGMKNLEMIGARYSTAKGYWYEAGDATLRTVTYLYPPDFQHETMHVETAGVRVEAVIVLAKNHAWERVEAKSEEYDARAFLNLRLEVYANQVASLVPVLRDSEFTLSLEPTQKVNDSPVDVVVVRKKDKPDIKLFFDQKSHLLVKTQHTRFYPTNNKQANFETFLADYRAIDSLEEDRKSLAAAKIPNDVSALKVLLRKQTLDPKEQAEIQKQIKAMGDDKFSAREDAKNALIKMGPRIVPLLEEAGRSTDPEISSRARECLQNIGKGQSPELLVAALHVFMNANDPEAVDILLAFLPATGHDFLGKEVRAALIGLAAQNFQARERVLLAAKNGDNNLKKALAPLVVKGELKDLFGYRVYPAGVKQPLKFVTLRDGKKTAEWSITELRFYHSLPASMFTQP